MDQPRPKPPTMSPQTKPSARALRLQDELKGVSKDMQRTQSQLDSAASIRRAFYAVGEEISEVLHQERLSGGGSNQITVQLLERLREEWKMIAKREAPVTEEMMRRVKENPDVKYNPINGSKLPEGLVVKPCEDTMTFALIGIAIVGLFFLPCIITLTSKPSSYSDI